MTNPPMSSDCKKRVAAVAMIRRGCSSHKLGSRYSTVSFAALRGPTGSPKAVLNHSIQSTAKHASARIGTNKINMSKGSNFVLSVDPHFAFTKHWQRVAKKLPSWRVAEVRGLTSRGNP